MIYKITGEKIAGGCVVALMCGVRLYLSLDAVEQCWRGWSARCDVVRNVSTRG